MDALEIAKIAQIASALEVSGYPKPGNVHRTRDYDDMVFEGKMRLEVHHRNYGEYIITMTSREASKDTGKIIVCLLNTYNDEIAYYLGQIVQYEEKEDVFELMK